MTLSVTGAKDKIWNIKYVYGNWSRELSDITLCVLIRVCVLCFSGHTYLSVPHPHFQDSSITNLLILQLNSTVKMFLKACEARNRPALSGF